MNQTTLTTTTVTIEQLYHDYHQSIRHYLRRLVHDREAAEDLCQETFIKALRHRSDLEHAVFARSWLYRIATNTAYDYLRRGRRIAITSLTDEYQALTRATTLEHPFDDAEPVWAAMNHLPEHYRVPLLLQLWAGYNLNDIATMLDCNVNTIKTRVHRARLRFREVYIA